MYMLAIVRKKIIFNGYLFLNRHHFAISIIETNSALFYRF